MMKARGGIPAEAARGDAATGVLAGARAWLLPVLGLVAGGLAAPASAWVYPEHRDIAVLAVEKLDPERRASLGRLWGEARSGHEPRLCERAADAAQGKAPPCIDWAALPGIAGDHSCSSKDMTEIVLGSGWILAVADVAARLKLELTGVAVLAPSGQVPGSAAMADFQRRMEAEGARAARLNALRTSDIRLQREDPEYATRATSNNAHFLLPRSTPGISAAEYGALTMKAGSEVSAVGAYTWLHLSALQKATRLAREELAPEARAALARAMLFDEGFAIHFLEDAFASGHVAGTWGDTSQRKGTHDYYNEAGLEVFTWKGGSESMVLMGDAHLRPEDAERAAAVVARSLAQVLDTAAGRKGALDLPHTPGAPSEPDSLGVCTNDPIPQRPEPLPVSREAYWQAYGAGLAEILTSTPVPGLGPGLGAMPRFRSEIGPFVGLSGVIDGRGATGAFTAPDAAGFMGGVELALRAGLGLEGVTSDSGDGLVFLSVGLRGDTASSNSLSSQAVVDAFGNLTAAIPARSGFTARLRVPFFLLPGDLILLSPLVLFSPRHYTNMAVVAGNGGLIPWQAGWATSIGRFQLVLGRELGVTLYGLTGKDRVLAPGATPGAATRLVAFESIAFDLPILEYRPYRSFSSNQSSTVLFQLFTAADVPMSSTVTAPAGAPDVALRTVWSFGLRLVFDWRYYW
jgi:hypothetical protein